MTSKRAGYRRPIFPERRWLQGAILIAGLVPVSAGLAGVVMGGGMAGGAGVDLDSHVRYLSGLLLGIGLLFWGMVPRIERCGAVVRALTFLVFVGGLARLAGVLFVGTPSVAMVAALAMELVVTPLLCLWQARIASCQAHVSGRGVGTTAPSRSPGAMRPVR